MSILKKFPWLYTRTHILHKLPDRGTLLDVGCGSGDMLRLIRTLKPKLKLYATDIYKHKDVPGYVKFFRSDLNKRIDHASSSFDIIISTHVIEHLVNHDVCAAEIHRVAKKDAYIFVEAPSTRSLWLPSFYFVGRSQDIPINFYDDYTHLRPYTTRSLHSLLSNAGLQVIKAGHVRHWGALLLSPLMFLFALFSGRREFLVHSLWNIVGWSCYCLARKEMPP